MRVLDEVEAQSRAFDVLIVDRFFLSILAMRGKDADDVALIRHLEDRVRKGREHVIFHMLTPPADCEARLRNRAVPDRIEEKGIDFPHDGVRALSRTDSSSPTMSTTSTAAVMSRRSTTRSWTGRWPSWARRATPRPRPCGLHALSAPAWDEVGGARGYDLPDPHLTVSGPTARCASP